MTTKALIAVVIIALLMGLIWLYGDARYDAGMAHQRELQEASNASQLREDALKIPEIKRKDEERHARIETVIKREAVKLPSTACFVTDITSDDIRLLDAAAPTDGS